MNGQYLYEVGDIVVYTEHPDVLGTIIEQLTLDKDSGLPQHTLDPTYPWYHIEWDDGDEQCSFSGEKWIGFEHQDSLTKVVE